MSFVIIAGDGGFTGFEEDTDRECVNSPFIKSWGTHPTLKEAADDIHKYSPETTYIEIINQVSEAVQRSAFQNGKPCWCTTNKKRSEKSIPE